MAGNDTKKAQGDSAGNGKKSGSASTRGAAGSGSAKSASAKSTTAKSGTAKSGTAKSGTAKSATAKSSGGADAKGDKAGQKKSSKAIPIAAAAAAVAVGGAVVVARRRRRKAEEAAEAERGKAKRTRSSARKSADGAEKKPRVAGGGLTQQVRPDAALGAVIGGREPMTRAEVTKRVWDYVKTNGLQDGANRRSINADAKLRSVFGKDQVTMFELPRVINSHVEKV
jgi:chromatin remodeling complex protein RSC6